MLEDLITGLMVAYRSVDYVKLTVESFRRFYPDLKFVIVNGSPSDDPCTEYCESKKDENTKVINLGKNFSHGLSLNIGMHHIETEYVYIFDSDVEMKNPNMLEKMINIMEEDTYGIGFINYVDRGGRGIKTAQAGDIRAEGEITYLHPFACIIRMKWYWEFPDFNFSGAPFILAMNAIQDSIDNVHVKYFPVKNYVKHYSGGTRAFYGDWPGAKGTLGLDKTEAELRKDADRFIP